MMSPDSFLNLGWPGEIVVFLVSCLPIFELRGALPLGINLLGMPWYYVLALALLGNLLPVPFLLFFFNFVAKYLRRFSFFNRILTWATDRSQRQGKAIAKHGWTGLMLFVAVPLPGTGAWAGSLVAVILGMKFWRAFTAIVVGVIVAGAAVTALCVLGITIAGIV
jgi:uncharacterized membrane protein